MKTLNIQEQIPVKKLRPIKLKDGKRRRITLNLKQTFGFVPEVLIIEKVYKENNYLEIMAVMTPEEVEKEKNPERPNLDFNKETKERHQFLVPYPEKNEKNRQENKGVAGSEENATGGTQKDG